MAELYDSCQETLLQYIDFLQTAQTPTQYAALLPSIQVGQKIGPGGGVGCRLPRHYSFGYRIV